jgi:hypothetical protein
MLRTKQKGRYGIRDKIAYAPWFYYFAAVENFIFRYWWIISIFEWS